MYRNIWKLNHGGICAIKFFNSFGMTVFKLTGFKVDKYLATDQSIFNQAKAEEVEITFVKEDGFTPKSSLRLPYKSMLERAIVGVKEEAMGIALFNINFPEFEALPGLQLSENFAPEIGQPIAILGFEAERENLSIKTGIVSSFFEKNGNPFVQVDANIQFGNSGSPLINPETNEVIGIIGHRLTEINKIYDQMMEIINNNLDQLKTAEGKVNVGELDPIQTVIATQNQIKYLTKELYKSTVHRVGYAYQIGYLVSYFKNNVELKKQKSSLKVRLGE